MQPEQRTEAPGHGERVGTGPGLEDWWAGGEGPCRPQVPLPHPCQAHSLSPRHPYTSDLPRLSWKH